MPEPTVVRLADIEKVSFGPNAQYQLILGDDDGAMPVRQGIQTSEPGYQAQMHSHPYIEILHVLEGTAEAWLDGQEDRKVILEKGDTIAVPPDTLHTFRVVGNETLRTFGTHVSGKRIVNYKDGASTDARGYRVLA